MKVVKIRNIVITVLFIFGILSGTLISLPSVASIIRGGLDSQETTKSKAFEDKYASLFTNYDSTINIYGAIQKTLGKREVKNFDVVKDDSGQLYKTEPMERSSSKEITQIADVYQKLAYTTESNGGVFFFVQAPYKNTEGINELKGYDDSHMDSNFTRLLNELERRNISAIDLRKFEECCQHYKTDHHWTVESSFSATTKTLEFIQSKTDIEWEHDKYNLSNYSTRSYPYSFLGSNGIRVGKYYGGVDDFNILVPDFATDITYQHLIDGKITKEKSGDFFQAFIDQSILADDTYHNKYNALLQGGYVENIIANHNIDNNKKLLFISHSYGRPMAQYLSLSFSEVRYLDPQDGRYNDNYLTYINEYKPDIVIVMYNDSINIEN